MFTDTINLKFSTNNFKDLTLELVLKYSIKNSVSNLSLVKHSSGGALDLLILTLNLSLPATPSLYGKASYTFYLNGCADDYFVFYLNNIVIFNAGGGLSCGGGDLSIQCLINNSKTYNITNNLTTKDNVLKIISHNNQRDYGYYIKTASILVETISK